ncbi:MAG: GNAT family N-acetyltransferase [Tissierellales bacterium]
MIEYNLAQKDDMKQIANFIAEINRKEESHIGYCGTDREEIENSLMEDITDIPFQEGFIVAKENEKLIGVLGFDSDLESNSAEIWGPFIIEDKWDIAAELWDKMMKILPNEISSISLFVNKKNENCIQLATNLNFNKVSEETILIFERNHIDKLQNATIIELSGEYNEDVQSLHDKTFPNTYYSGSQIIDRMNNHRKVFINIENENLAGYIYVEVNPEFGEGSIEFFAVDESERGKGIGSKLLTMALKWIFTFESIGNITLCVNSENEKALKLYKKVGFKEKHQLYYFTRAFG